MRFFGELNIKLILFFLLISAIMSFIFQSFLNSKIEYKFVNTLNNGEIKQSFSMFCDYEEKDNFSIKYEQRLSEFLGEDKLFTTRNFTINRIFPVGDEKAEFEYGFMFGYDLFYAEYGVTLKRVNDKIGFVKINGEKRCLVLE